MHAYTHTQVTFFITTVGECSMESSSHGVYCVDNTDCGAHGICVPTPYSWQIPYGLLQERDPDVMAALYALGVRTLDLQVCANFRVRFGFGFFFTLVFSADVCFCVCRLWIYVRMCVLIGTYRHIHACMWLHTYTGSHIHLICTYIYIHADT